MAWLMKALAVASISKPALSKPTLTPWMVAALLLGLLATPAAWAKQRFALVIGNGAYYEKQAGVNDLKPLSNPRSDALDMAALLKSAGFTLVDDRRRNQALVNANKGGMRNAINHFVERLRTNPGAEGVFYFSGHGVYLNDLKYPRESANYLLPVGANYRAASPYDIKDASINAHTLIRKLGSTDAQVLVILDACREELALKESYGFGANQQFVPMTPSIGVKVAYATQHAYSAWANTEAKHSRYTGHLLDVFNAMPGASFDQILGQVNKRITEENPHLDAEYRQFPWEEGSFYNPICLYNCESGVWVQAPVENSETLLTWLERYQLLLGLGLLALSVLVFSFHRKSHQPEPATRQPYRKEPVTETETKNPLRPAEQPNTVKPEPEKSRRYSVNGVDFKLVHIPTGEFLMGSNEYSDEQPIHKVQITEFYMMEHQVTYDLWDAFCREPSTLWDALFKEKPYRTLPIDMGFGRGTRPVIGVSWNDIVNDFIPWLNQKTGKIFRLPTEAEWEYACRAGTTTRYSWGDDLDVSRACYNRSHSLGTTPVKSYPANAFGLYDMHGNVLEWTQDCWNDSYSGAPDDGSAWKSGDCTQRVLRGGAWIYNPPAWRSACRFRDSSSNHNSWNGFRLVQAP